MLALATLANILTFSDTLLLSDANMIETLGRGMPMLVDTLKTAQQKPQGLYAAACIANASFHPRLAALLNQNGGILNVLIVMRHLLVFLPIFMIHTTFITALQLCRELERQSFANLHLLGSKVGECMQTAVYRLSERKEGEAKMGNAKYRYYFDINQCVLHIVHLTHCVSLTVLNGAQNP